jgi:hypothetical protein
MAAQNEKPALKVDPQRYRDYMDMTGIPVRAQMPDGKWQSVDLATLTPESITEWFKEDEERAKRTALMLMGYR